MYLTDEEESQRFIELGHDIKEIGLIHLSRPMIVGLLISLAQQYKQMKDSQRDKHYEIGMAKIAALDAGKTCQERSSRFYDARYYQSKMSI